MQNKLASLEKEYSILKEDEYKYTHFDLNSYRGITIIAVIVAICIIAFHVIIKHFAVDVLKATELTDAMPVLVLANGIIALAFGIFLRVSYFCETIWGFLISAGISYAVLNLLSAIYIEVAMHLGSTLEGTIWIAMAFFLVVLAIVYVSVCIYFRSQNKAYRRMNFRFFVETTKKENNKQKEIAKAKQDILNHELELKKKVASIKVEQVKETAELKAIKAQMEQFYSSNLIHPKYRELTALSKLYEYLDTGRCYTLEGPHGGYNLYEQELMAGRIVSSNNAISSTISSSTSKVTSALERNNY